MRVPGRDGEVYVSGVRAGTVGRVDFTHPEYPAVYLRCPRCGAQPAAIVTHTATSTRSALSARSCICQATSTTAVRKVCSDQYGHRWVVTYDPAVG